MPDKFEYRLHGFSTALHMRLTPFQAPLPASRVCSICGVVPKNTALLPCCHPVCQSCFEAFVTEGNVCSLDKMKFREDQVDWMEFSEQQLLRHPVFCWNVDAGCKYQGPVMSLPHHYHVECQFHVVPCPRCSLPVLRRDVVNHCDDDGDPRFMSVQAAEQQDREVLGSVTKALEKLSVEKTTLLTSFNLLAENIRSECSSLRGSFSTEAVKHSDISDLCEGIKGIVDDVEGSVKEYLGNEFDALSKKATKAAEDCAQNVLCIHSINKLHWYLDKWDNFKLEAATKGTVYADSISSYMHGYNVLSRVRVVKTGTQLNFGLSFRLVKGDHDSILEWPFRRTFILSVIHPQDISKSLSVSVDATKYPEKGALHRPKDNYDSGLGTSALCTAQVLDSEGFVADDSLHLGLEILP